MMWNEKLRRLREIIMRAEEQTDCSSRRQRVITRFVSWGKLRAITGQRRDAAKGAPAELYSADAPLSLTRHSGDAP